MTHDQANDRIAKKWMMELGNRSFDTLQAIDALKELRLDELRDILQALNEKVKSSLALRCNYLESDFAAFLEDAASDCAFQIKKEQDQAERDRAEYDEIMENGSLRQRQDAHFGDRSNASVGVAA